MKYILWKIVNPIRKLYNQLKVFWSSVWSFLIENLVEKLVLSAYSHPDKSIHKFIRRNWDQLYGITKVTTGRLRKSKRNNQFFWKAQSDIYNKGHRSFLGIRPIGFRNLSVYCKSDSVLESQLYLYGTYDEIITLKLYQDIIIPDSIIVDVGANIGIHSLALADIVSSWPRSRVIAYEPKRELVKRLHSNLKLNNLSKVVKVSQIGLWSEPGKIYFNEDVLNFNQGVGRYDPTSNNFIEVTSLDKDLDNLSTPITLIKIDVEGAELEVIRGGIRLLEKHRPSIVIEHNSPPWTLEQLVEVIPYEVIMTRIPNTYYEESIIVDINSTLQGFNNLLLAPKYLLSNNVEK